MTFSALSLKPFNADDTPVLEGELAHYLDFYGMNIADELAVDYRIGTVASGDYRIACQGWRLQSGQQSKGTILVVHGLYDHTALYGHLIRFCLEAGYSVLALDLPGHGLSSGYPTAVDSFQDYVDAVVAVTEMAESFLPGPYIGIGQSTGGAVLATAQQQKPELFQRNIFLAPLFYPFGWKLGMINYRLFHRFVRSIPRNFKESSHDLAFCRFLREEDPMQVKRLSLTWITALKDWHPRFESEAVATGPVLFIQGEADATVDWKRNLPIYQRQFSNLKTVMIPEGRHNLVNEAPFIRDQVFAAILDFAGS